MLFLFATPIAAVLICFTVVGLGVGISVLFLVDRGVFGPGFCRRWLGEKILGPSTGSAGARPGGAGLLILRLLDGALRGGRIRAACGVLGPRRYGAGIYKGSGRNWRLLSTAA